MLDWQAVQDGYVITRRMSDWEVWKRSQLFGCPALSYGLERLIEDLQKGGTSNVVLNLVRNVG